MQTFRNRYILVCVAIGLALLALLLGASQWQASRVAGAQGAQQLEHVTAVQRLAEALHREDLTHRAERIATDPAFAGYVDQAMGGALPGVEIDTTSIVDLLEERRSELNLAEAAVINGRGEIVASTVGYRGRRDLGDNALFVAARDTLTLGTGLWDQGQRLLHVALLPLAAVGSGEGFLLVAVDIDREFAKSIGAGIGGEAVVVRTGAKPGELATSSLSEDAQPPLSQALAGRGADAASTFELAFGGQRYVAIRRPLLEAKTGHVLMLVPQATGAAAAVENATRLPSLLTLALVVVAWTLLSLLAWRFVLRPVDVVTQYLERASGGDYHLQLPDKDTGAMTRLASAFNALMQTVRVPRG